MYLLKVVGIIIGLGIIVGNFLLLLTVAINKQYHTITFTFIVNLAVADMLAGAIFIFIFVGGLELQIEHKTTWFLRYGGTILTLTASGCGSLATVVDRYIEISSLTVQSQLANPRRVRRCIISISLSWVTALGLSLAPVLGWNCLDDERCSGNYNGLSHNYLRSAIAFEFCISIATHVVYVLIYRFVQASAKRGAQQVGNVDLQIHLWRKTPYLKKTALVLVLGAFITTWLPFLILIFVNCVFAHCVLDDPLDLVIPFAALLNSVMNPVVYALRNKESRGIYLFRRPILLQLFKVLQLLGMPCGRQQTATSETEGFLLN